jgi:hypothetical protein
VTPPGDIDTSGTNGGERERLFVELLASRDAALGAELSNAQLRGRVKALEAELDDRERHLRALLNEVASLRQRVEGLEQVSADRDALLGSPTWRAGVALMGPVRWLRRLGHPQS